MKRLAILFCIALTSVLLAEGIEGQKQLKKLINAEFAISQFYVDSVNTDKLV